jgi:hypothetical protein
LAKTKTPPPVWQWGLEIRERIRTRPPRRTAAARSIAAVSCRYARKQNKEPHGGCQMNRLGNGGADFNVWAVVQIGGGSKKIFAAQAILSGTKRYQFASSAFNWSKSNSQTVKLVRLGATRFDRREKTDQLMHVHNSSPRCLRPATQKQRSRAFGISNGTTCLSRHGFLCDGGHAPGCQGTSSFSKQETNPDPILTQEI